MKKDKNQNDIHVEFRYIMTVIDFKYIWLMMMGSLFMSAML